MTINGQRPGRDGRRRRSPDPTSPRLNGRRRPTAPTSRLPGARELSASLLGDVKQALRSARITALTHEAVGCPAGGPGGGCRPCEVLQRERWAERDRADREAALAQHAVSAARLARVMGPANAARARRLARDAPKTRVLGGARGDCRACAHTADGVECRACGVTRSTPGEIQGFLDVLNGRRR
jgi:hypothetical protein